MWHYTIDNNPQEPVDETIIPQLIANGTIQAHTLVWREGMADWIPLASSELARYAAPQSAVTQRPGPVRRAPGAVVAPVSAVQNRQVVAANPYAAPQAGPMQVHRGPASAMTWKKILWSFEGRIARRTYWAGIGIWFGVIISVIILTVLLIKGLGEENAVFALIPLLLIIIPVFWSSLAMQIKRWHDRGKPGVMVLVNLIPFVGGIWAFVECGCLRGSVGPNQYGQDPT
jgi:uncharacterized membrane protein YhaH (DUF805 family)